MQVPKSRFDELVRLALERVPPVFRDEVRNVEISVEDLPGPEAAEMEHPEELLGLYVGPSLLEAEGSLSMPSRIVLYQRNLEQECRTETELIKEIELTLRHELAHHFGFEEEELHRVWPEGA